MPKQKSAVQLDKVFNELPKKRTRSATKIWLVIFVCWGLSACKREDNLLPTNFESKEIGNGIYFTIARNIKKPPAENSPEQAKDVSTLLSLQASRKAEDCDRAQKEKNVSLAIFFGPPYGPLNGSFVPALSPFFIDISVEADRHIQKLKRKYKRPRPPRYLDTVIPCVPVDVEFSYPSGHATHAMLYALILSELFPMLESALKERAIQIGNNRVMAGVHHPSDITAGLKLAELLYAELKNVIWFKEGLADLRSNLKTD